MKKLQMSAVVCAAFLVTGCAAALYTQSDAAIQMNYKAENASAAGVVQVFDLDSNTVVQIKNIERSRPIILDRQGKEMTYKVVGQNAVLSGIHPSFRVLSQGAISEITRIAAVQTAEVKAKPQALAQAQAEPQALAQNAQASEKALVDQYAAKSDEELLADLARMRKELAELKVLLAAVPKSAPAPAPVAQPPRTPLYEERGMEQSTVLVQFKDNSYEFEPSPSAANTIIAHADTNTNFNVSGYTDSFVATPQAENLAKRRAIEAKKYLVAKGINSKKITVRYYPTGRFIHDNRTEEGRAANRRVEIAMK